MAYSISSEPRRDLPSMHRSVSQLLFSYLPGKTVDWEDGLAIVQLGSVLLSTAWEAKEADLVFKEIGEYLARWRSEGGMVHPDFPDPPTQRRCTIGEPKSIAATVVETALRCLSCNRLVFSTRRQMAASTAAGAGPFVCPSCHKQTLRQFPQVFVHGCGELVPLREWMPTLTTKDGAARPTKYPLFCKACGRQSIVEIPLRGERARDLVVTCRTCNSIAHQRITVRCPSCIAHLPPLPPPPADQAAQETPKVPTIMDRVFMRATSYRASEAYYPHTLTILRLDRQHYVAVPDEEVRLLRELAPEESQGNGPPTKPQVLSVLVARLLEAQTQGKTAEAEVVSRQISDVASGVTPVDQVLSTARRLAHPSQTLAKNVLESLAFKTTVRATPYTTVLERDQHGATAGLRHQIEQAHRRLGLRETLLVDDLPVISATFGFTRRSFEPTYEEGEVTLSTRLCPFYTLNHMAAAAIRRPSAVGTVPILAREGDHEGIFLQLDPERVLTWLARNGLLLPGEDQPAIFRILEALEHMDRDRYYDHIRQARVMRVVYGLLHSLSHAAMRVVSRFAGLERTSISEYLFLPLLGTVIYANSSTLKMGCMETMVKSSMYEFLEALAEEAMACPIDPDCIDHQGACAGCLHSPEISCRVFNHGLSRALLTGGHAYWSDASVDERVTGYWQLPAEQEPQP